MNHGSILQKKGVVYDRQIKKIQAGEFCLNGSFGRSRREECSTSPWPARPYPTAAVAPGLDSVLSVAETRARACTTMYIYIFIYIYINVYVYTTTTTSCSDREIGLFKYLVFCVVSRYTRLKRATSDARYIDNDLLSFTMMALCHMFCFQYLRDRDRLEITCAESPNDI